jgi:hypothetical protein
MHKQTSSRAVIRSFILGLRVGVAFVSIKTSKLTESYADYNMTLV